MLRTLLIAIVLITVIFPLNAVSKEYVYCEDVSNYFSYFKNADEAFTLLTTKAETAAINDIFKNELESLTFSVFPKSAVVDSLRDLIIYDIEMYSSDAFKPCIKLTVPNTGQFDAVRNRFKAIKVASMCTNNIDLLKKFQDISTNEFIAQMKAGKEYKQTGIEKMLNDPALLRAQSKAQLRTYFHTRKFQDSDGMECAERFVYPIELFAASTPWNVPFIQPLPVISSTDAKGKNSTIEMIIITPNNYFWQLGSYDQIEKDGKDITDTFIKPFSAKDFQSHVRNNLQSVIAIGMASCEGSADVENHRARKRAETLMSWISQAFIGKVDVEILGINLGRYNVSPQECKELWDEKASAQRRILIIGITRGSDQKIDRKVLIELMRNIAETRPEALPINPDDYELFEFIQYH